MGVLGKNYYKGLVGCWELPIVDVDLTMMMIVSDRNY